MKKDYGKIFIEMRNLFIVAGLAGSLLVGQVVFAAEEDYATAKNVLEADQVNPEVENSITIEEEPIVEFEGTVSDNSPVCEFNYTPSEDGDYNFVISNIQASCNIRFTLYDSFGNHLTYHNGDSFDIAKKLTGGKSYTLHVEKDKENTDFKIQIWGPKPSTDIANYTSINDQIMYEKEENIYFYTAPVSGVYDFSFYNFTNDVDFMMYVYDENGLEILRGAFDENREATVEMVAGNVYKIIVSHAAWSGLGGYTLNIDSPKLVNITGYTDIYDKLEFENQINSYTFDAPVGGEYKIVMTNAKEVNTLNYTIYNSKNEIVERDYFAHEDHEKKMSFNEGEEYLIEIEQDSILGELGDYTFKICYPYSAQQFLDDFSNGNITETEDNELDEQTDEIVAETEADDDNISTDDLILQQLEDMQSEMNELKEENENLKNVLDENEIEYD